MTVADIDRYSIQPPHEVRDAGKLATIADAMRAAGWEGRPLLVVASGDGWQAMTGSHRLAAARLAGLANVPAWCVEPDDLTDDQWLDLDACRDDDDRLAVFVAANLTDAVDLMRAEIAANDHV